jgi:hypothetical protein
MQKYISPPDAAPEEIKWIIEIIRHPGDDEGMQTLYGPFNGVEFEDAVAFAKKEFGKAKGNWHMRSIWPVYKRKQD